MSEMPIFAAMNPETSAKACFRAVQVPFRQTGYFSDLVLDYLDGNEKLQSFYGYLPRIENFSDQIAAKASHYKHREALVAALKSQYALAGMKSAPVDALASPEAYTITTGHQVCLFTGPVYFIYKIASAIKTCQMLSERHPNKQFVPVFWMATEDHDLAEANHFHLKDGKHHWDTDQQGAVGRMRTEGLESIAEDLVEALGLGYHAAELQQLFERAYLKHDTIAAATRHLVHALFSKYGVICVDGDDPALKALAIPAFRKELFEQVSEPAVNATNARLSAHYRTQAHPRDINLFYLSEQSRERIVRNEDGHFEVLNTSFKFDENQMEAELTTHPERFSPNVILRPLYQEIILPNLAYIGGGGELAYWFQLKDMFEVFDVPFPILMLRNSALVVDTDGQKRMKQLGLGLEDVFTKPGDLETRLIKRESPDDMELSDSRKTLNAEFQKLETRLGEMDQTLMKSVRSAQAKAERLLHNLEKKMLRAERKKQETLLNRFHAWHEGLFPGASLQERKMNFAVFYLPYGPAFIDCLIAEFDPFEDGFSLLLEGEAEGK